MKPKPYNPDWPLIPIEYKWVGVGKTGNVNAFKSKPYAHISYGVWWVEPDIESKIVDDKIVCSITYSNTLNCPPIDPPGKKWRTMLYERPEQIEK